uniref:Uncharacterized protein n=1 Tax=Trypanosoma congolense (strain IL3000) TaxID=1068625 RepID=G0UW40_TRYCI|nr:conserved hypothetical protein [Trypanosoma congolense IL3000]
MDQHLRQQIEIAAQCIKEGQHSEAERVVRNLQAIDDPHATEYVFRILNWSVHSGANDDMVYVHFASLRLMRVFFIRFVHLQGTAGKELLTSLQLYAQALGDRLLTAPWRSVMSEAALNMAVILKLRCVGEEGTLKSSAIDQVISDVLGELSNCTGEPMMVLYLSVTVHLIEEFGLYRPPSRGRGVSIKFHRECRAAFECDGLVRFLNVFFGAAVSGTVTSRLVAESLIGGLSAALSWSRHAFFEEDVPHGDSCAPALRVSGALWYDFLMKGVPVQGTMTRVEEVLKKWYLDGRMCEIAVERRSIVELVREFCNIVIDSWELTEKVNYGGRVISLVTLVAKDILGNMENDEGTRSELPVALSGISNVLENLPEIFTFPEILEPSLAELLFIVKHLIDFDCRNPDNDDIMAALDEILSFLFKLTQLLPNNVPSIASVALSVFDTYLSSKLSCALSSMSPRIFATAFAESHISLVACLGRQDPVRAVELLCAALNHLSGDYINALRGRASNAGQVQEKLWVVARLSSALIVDTCDGEQVAVPPCFTEYSFSGPHPVLKIVASVCNLLRDMLPNLSSASPAVVAALLDVLGGFTNIYMRDPEGEGVPMTGVCVAIIRYALCSLRAFAFDGDVGAAVCRVLSAGAKSACAIGAFQACPEAQREAEEIASGGHRVGEVVRGHVAAFCVVCLPQEAVEVGISRILHTFDVHASDFTSVDVSVCLERCGSLSGFLTFLRDSDRLYSCLGGVTEDCDHIVALSSTRFYEKELVIRSTELILHLFLAYSPLLMDEPLLWLCGKVTTTLNEVIKALVDNATWRADDAEEEKLRLLKLVTSLLSEIAQWVMMESTLPPEATHSLGTCVISALAAFLDFFDERCLKLPELKESVLRAFQLCSEAFTSEFVSLPDSQVFLSVLMFTLDSDTIDGQRVGTTVAECVVSFMHRAGVDNHELFSSLLYALTRSFLSGRLSIALSPQIAKCLTALCGCLPPQRLEKMLREVTTATDGCPQAAVILCRMFSKAQECSGSNGQQRIISLRCLADIITESLCGIRGILLV